MRGLRLSLFVLLALAALAGCRIADWLVLGSGIVVDQASDLAGFTAIDAGSGFSVDAQRGESFSILLRTDDNVLPHVRVLLEGERLVLSLEPGFSTWPTVLHASVTMPDLRGIGLSGGSVATVAAGFETVGTFAAALSGGSRLSLTSLSCAALRADLSGGSDIDGAITCPGGAAELALSGGSRVRALSGEAGTLGIDQSGGSTSDLSQLIAETADVTLSGGSVATVSVQSSLTANLSGGSRLSYRRYEAGPAITAIDASGGSSISSY